MVLVTCSRPLRPGIEQQDALPVGELDRRHVGLAGDLGNLVEIGAVFLPVPDVGLGLELRDRDAAAGELAAAGAVGLAEPGLLRRRVRLGADPDVMLAGVGVDRLHQLAGLVGEPARGGRLHCHGGHDVFSCNCGLSAHVLDLETVCPTGHPLSRAADFGPGIAGPASLQASTLIGVKRAAFKPPGNPGSPR